MKIKKYVAEDFQTAIKQAKTEMGKDAIILNSRNIKKNGILNFLFHRRDKEKVEVTVAVDEDLKIARDKIRKSEIIKESYEHTLNENRSIQETNINEQQLFTEMQKMSEIMADVKSKIYEVEHIKGISDNIRSFYEILLENNVEKEIAISIANSIESRLPSGLSDDYEWVKEVCVKTLQDYFCQVQPIEVEKEKKGKVVVLVGPTGVGKTTTIAKLAANFTFLYGKKVAFITLDTYRVSAAEQLRTFADIIGVSIKVVFNASDLSEAISECSDRDLIFIDTAGRSPYNNEQMVELKEYLDIAQADETILVLSVTTDSKDLKSIYENFNIIPIDKIIFTKLDETRRYGQILNVITTAKKPVAYFTTGQSVPDDIEVPDSLSFARMILGEGEA